MARKRKNSLARTFISMIVIIIGVIVCSITTVAAVDIHCRNDINKWLPVYPYANLVSTEEEGFFRTRASGITRQIYYTDDSPVEVRQWYREYRRELTSNLSNENSPNTAARGVATTRYQVAENSDNSGTIIMLYSECAYN